MPKGFLLCFSICIALSSSGLVKAATNRPVVQLTVQPPRYLLTRDDCIGNVLLRELQRQALLISARDELGLGTRDMVLHEPFAVHNSPGVTTVLIESRITRGDQAQICLARFDGPQPVNPYTLADLQVDQPQNVCQQWVGFKIEKNELVDYPAFVTKCEEASRTTFLVALKGEKVLGDAPASPIQWVMPGNSGAASPAALDHLRHLDVFSQFIALRLLHGQMVADGASVDRLSALVQAYSNLGELASGQWSQAYKVFYARALLYAQRQVVHENASAASLYVRAYARATAGLHAAALEDLDLADKTAGHNTPPPWAGIIRAESMFDPVAAEQAISTGVWRYRELATYLSAIIDGDEFPTKMDQDSISRALFQYPGMFELAILSNDTGDGITPRPADQVAIQLPLVLVNTLTDPALPSSVQYVLKHMTLGDDSYRQIAQVRDRLISSASRVPLETAEPSQGVLADIIEQEEMVAIAHKAVTARNGGGFDLTRLLTSAQPIVKFHPWHALVEGLGGDFVNDPTRLKQNLESVKDRDPGGWIGPAVDDLNLTGDATKITQAWRKAANLTADSIPHDYSEFTTRAKAVNGDVEHYLWLLRKTSPHSAVLMDAWISAMQLGRLDREKSLYEQTLRQVESEFSYRPGVLESASRWCESQGDFSRSLKLLQQADQLDPSADCCDHLARTLHRLGRNHEAIDYLLRGVALANNGTGKGDAGALYQRAAAYLISDQRYADALTCIQVSADSPTPRTWALLTRCYETMGQLEDADECLSQQAISNPQATVQHYLWARRLQRRDANDIRKRAVLLVTGQHTASEFFLAMADDQEAKAMNVLRESSTGQGDAFGFVQLMILAKKLGNTDVFNTAQKELNQTAVQNSNFAAAMISLITAKDLPQGIAGFDRWVQRQLEDEYEMDWYSLAGRYLVESGHAAEGREYLVRAIRQPARERENYYLAWRELQKLGENPKRLMNAGTTLP